MDNWRDLDPAGVAGMFDAQLNSIVIRSDPAMMRPNGFHIVDPDSGNERDLSMSELDLSEPGIRLLLGRNGSGKSTLLKQLGPGISEFSANLNASWIYSLPSEELLARWDELVSEASESVTFLGTDFDDPCMLEEIVRLPIMDVFRDQQISFEEGSASEEEFSLLQRLGFREVGNHFEGRFDPTEDRTFCGPPQSYSPRLVSWQWLLHSLRQGACRMFEGPGDLEVVEFGRPEWGAHLVVDSTFYVKSESNSQIFVDAVSQFFQSIWGIEFMYFGGKPRMRFLSSLPDSGPLMKILSDRDRALANEAELAFPLDFFKTTPMDSLASVWLDCAPDWGSGHFLTALEAAVNKLNSFILSTVVDLRGDIEAQLSAMWSRVIDSHLKVMVIRGTESASSDSGSDSSMSGSPAAGREHIIVDGYDRLNEFLLGLAEDLLELDIGVDGLRAFRPHEAGWSKVSSKPGGFFGSLDFGEEMQGRQILQSPKSRWMSELVLQWKQPITGRWLELESASQGQRDIILMLLAMAASPKGGVPASKDHLLLIDEFDQHLHQTVTSKFLEIAQRRALQWGTRAILSTHSAPILAHPSTRQLPRIFARRTVDGAFSYSQRPPETGEQLAAELGVDLLSALAFARMFVMVEGEHDEVVLQSLLTTGRGGEEVAGVELINARGTWAFEGIWNNVLRYFSAPVLVVHDKLDRRFEKAWAELKERAGRDGETMPRWVETDFHRMRVEIDDRSMKKKSRRGDDETDKMLKVVFSIFGGREGLPSARDVLRLTFHGIDSPDIIRLLPIDHFLDARRHGSWEAAEEWWGRQGKGNSWNEEFKKSLKLTTAAVRTTLSKTQDGWHSELQRLYDVMTNLYHAGGPEERNG